MTRQQKIILIALGIVNGLIFCCAVPVLVILGGGSTSAQVAAKTTTTRTPTITPTITATPTPVATNTFVLRPPPPPPTQSRPTVTPRSLQAGWKFYDVSDEGFAMGLPPNWDRVNLDPESFATFIQTMRDKNPKFAATFANLSNQLVASQIKFFAIDASQQALASDTFATMNVIREPLPVEISLDAYVQANLTNLSRSGLASSQITHKRVKLVADPAEEFRYQTISNLTSNNKPISVLQYALVHKNFGFVITFGTSPDKDKQYSPIFQKMMSSFQWTP